MNLSAQEQHAVSMMKEKLQHTDSSAEIVLFGSKARGDADADSDIDLLILTNQPVDHKLELAVRAIAFDIELEYDVVFGVVVMNRSFWNTKGLGMPLRWNIDREGVAV